MFALAFGIGIFSYIIFFLGIERFLFAPLVLLITLIFWGEFLWWQKNVVYKSLISFGQFLLSKKPKFFFIVLGFLLLQVLINIVGVLGPEIGFDALWYHLTLPQLYLQWHQVRHIAGGLMYYSDMPKLTEMLYIPGLALFAETGAKLIHFLFGILCSVALYKLGRKFFNPLLSIIAVAIFYSNLVVGWESVSAYIDLARTFFAIMAVLGFFNWYESKKVKWLVASALCLGLGIATKFLALVDIGIFIPLIIYIDWKKKSDIVKHAVLFVLICLVVPLPWWTYSYVQTGNPFYPFFTPIYPTVSSLNLNPVGFISTLWTTFTHSPDPLNPLYIAFLPFLFLVKKWDKNLVLLLFVGGLSLIIWYISPQTGGGRFLLPYLPALSLLVVLVFKNLKGKYLQGLFLICLFTSLLVSIGYRAAANVKYIPVILGKETKTAFLTKHLNFSFGDWVDVDGYMTKHIKSTDIVLLYGYHNLYYIDFPYIHESWVKKGDVFDYLATDGGKLPERFKDWKLVYQNTTTHLHLYSNGGNLWMY